MSIINPNNIVVFDLDETLGYFYQLSIFWNMLNDYFKTYLSEEDFIKVLELYPEFLRPNIIDILKYVITKKKNKKCSKIMIYTNNQGEKKWTQMICNFFDKKLKTKTFDQIIAAFKINGEKVELCRSSHDKSVSDLIKCTKIPENTRICFLDDQFHSLMEHDNVYYINLKPYEHSISFEEMALRYYNKFNNNFNKIDNDDFVDFAVKYMKSNYKYNSKSDNEQQIDNIISKKILTHLKEFFKDTLPIKKTKKHKNKSKNKNKNKTKKIK